MADPMYYPPDGDGYPDIRLDMFLTVSEFDRFNRRDDDEEETASGCDWTAWQTCKQFFEAAAAALKAMGSKVTLELICGGLSEELAKMRFKGDLTRPATFPRKYTRMWLSNVPSVHIRER